MREAPTFRETASSAEPREPAGAASRRQAAALVGATCVALVAVHAVARAAALDPGTLWYDDVWVAALTRLPAAADLLAARVPAAPGFLLLERLCRSLIADPELSLQAVPFAMGLATIPLLALLAWRLTGSASLAVVGAGLAALSGPVVHYSVFAKGYTIDMVVTTALLLLALPLARHPSLRRLGGLAAASLVAPVMSLPSPLPGTVLVHLGALLLVRHRGREALRPVATMILCYDACLLLLWWGWLGHLSGPLVREYWRPFYLPLGEPRATLPFLGDSGLEAVRGAVPGGSGVGIVLAGLGALAGLRRPATRLLTWAALLVAAGWLALSAARLYPLGGGRTDIFSYPLTMALVVVGVGFACRLATALLAAGAAVLPVSPVSAPVLEVRARGLVAAAVVGFALLAPPVPTYHDVPQDSRTVARLVGELQATDALLIHPRAAYLFGYYGPWPVRAVADEGLQPGVRIDIVRPRTTTMPYGSLGEAAASLNRFLAAGPHARIWLAVARARPEIGLDVFARRVLGASGYAPVRELGSGRTSAQAWEPGAGAAGDRRILIDVGEEGDQVFLGSGWWNRGRQAAFSSRWGIDAESTMHVPLRGLAVRGAVADADAVAYRIVFRGHPLSAPELPAQRVEIRVDGELVGDVEMGPSLAVYEVAVPFRALRRPISEVRFGYARSPAPAELGLSRDPRHLGVRFDWIHFLPGP